MQEGQNARQQVIERIRQSNSILVAVANSPSVDALSGALGLSLMLNKLNKHTTALFSGEIPPAIQFLEPSKLFESNVDALRDFIISLDKEKADRLRYKVEDDVVRIFITPYKTSIGQADLQFSQGDFNVDLIIALGVEKREDLDKVIIAHGRILHDATVITINADNNRSTLGAIDWNDATASSLCEMLVGLTEAFNQPGILDTQIATALLTGIVAETERFSNVRTSPRVMTMAAQLMAAGANQQLIATNLTKAHEIPEVSRPMAQQQAVEAPQPMPQEQAGKNNDGELSIPHTSKPQDESPKTDKKAPIDDVKPTAEQELEAALPVAAEPTHALAGDLKDELNQAAPTDSKPALDEDQKVPGSESVNKPEPAQKPEHGEDEDYISSHSSWRGKRLEPPTLGGTLNATSEQAQKQSQADLNDERNGTLLSHPDDTASQQDAPQKQKRSRRDKRDKSKKSQDTQAALPPAPVAPVVAQAPEFTPQSQTQDVNASEAAPDITAPMPPMPDLPPLPPMPAMPQVNMPPMGDSAPVAAPQDMQVPLPPMAQPEPFDMQMPAPDAAQPAADAAPALEPEVNLDALQQEALRSATEAAAIEPVTSEPVSTQPDTAPQMPVVDLDTARQAVDEALSSQPFNPAGQPAASIGAQPLPPMPVMPMMDPAQGMAQNPESNPVMPPMPDLPPLPPMPPMPQADTPLPPVDASLPAAPSLPGLSDPLAPPADQPQQAPQPPIMPTNDPGQFKIPGA